MRNRNNPPETRTGRRYTRHAELARHRRHQWAARVRAGTAVAIAALLVAPYLATPLLNGTAWAQTAPISAEASAPSQSVRSETATAQRAPRDEFTTTQVLPGQFSPYANTADTFTNNPASPVQWPFTRGVPFGTRFTTGHTGLDMNPGVGTPVQAIAAGVVLEAGNAHETYGVYAIIQHTINGKTVTSLYGHMQQGSLVVKMGDKVSVTQPVGQVGSSGQSTGPHLHLSIRVSGELVDPYGWLTRTVQP